VRWHKRAFKLYWRRKSRAGKRGRPALDSDVRALILKMTDANPLWGAPKIHGELLKLGAVVSERTVSGLLRRRKRKPPSQTWRTFIKNHMSEMVAVDFLVVPTIRFRMLYVVVFLGHAQRRIVHFNVTTSPMSAWAAQQINVSFCSSCLFWIITLQSFICSINVRLFLKSSPFYNDTTRPMS